MRIVVAAMGRLVPELVLLACELSRRFESVSVLLGSNDTASERLAACARLHNARFGLWSTDEPNAELQRRLEGADAVIHLPPRTEEAPPDSRSLRQDSIGYVAEAVKRLGHRCPRKIVEVVPAQELEAGDEDDVAATVTSGVRVCTAQIGVVLRAPGGALRRTLCALRAQAALNRASCLGLVRWIHELDGVRAIAHVLENDSLTGRFNLMAPAPVPAATFASTIWSAYGLPSSLRGPATASVGRLLDAPPLAGPVATPRRLVESGFAYLFPDLPSALADLTEQNS
ncbi:Cell division inhibitor [Labilithrix luteola]|uniref:Cell division inhibitor n=1 Tax=Labilithrix luteola TaxID=1391654 RepID=A0A0K1PWS4_9BACT|nr:DUF1731 domain-containing protein [Labilithrix luteola]AKU97826.1 Cell division inhibitor [Labilithrix luteola]